MTLSTSRQAIPYPEQTNVKDLTAQFAAMSAVADDKYVLRFFSTSARDAAITSPIEGMLCYISGLDVYTFYNGTAWERLENGKVLYATLATQTYTSTTLQQIQGLSFTAVANAVYQYRLEIAYGSAATFAADIARQSWQAPTGTTMAEGWSTPGANTTNRLTASPCFFAAPATIGQRSLGGSNTASPLFFQEKGIIRVGSLGGTICPTFARSSTATSVFTYGQLGTKLIITRVS